MNANMEFKEVKIVVNGKEIELNRFAALIIGNTVRGMVSSLNLEDEPKEIEVKVSKQ